MAEIIAYEMIYTSDRVYDDLYIEMSPFSAEIYEEYEKIYNECFFEMRKALDVQPYNFYSSIDQIKDKMNSIFVLMDNYKIVGSVSFYGNEIDDLIVNKKYQGNGYGEKILFWAINYIRKNNNKPISLHVAKWNEKALNLYKNNGFICAKTEKIR